MDTIRRFTDVKHQQLQAADIFLYHGGDTVGRMIEWFDGSPYSHASIFDGTDCVEATPGGILTDNPGQSTSSYPYVDIFRFRSKQNVWLGNPSLPARPVLDRIKFYQQQSESYAYDSIILLATICTLRHVPAPLARWISDLAAEAVKKILDAGKNTIICSELVYRCFSEAGGNYTPEIAGANLPLNTVSGELKAAPSVPGLEPPEDELEARVVRQAFLEIYNKAKISREPTITAAGLTIDPSFVTPGDLYSSPNFVKIGTFRN